MPTTENIAWNDLLVKTKAGQPPARELLFRELSVRLRLILSYRLWGWSKKDQEDLVQDCLCTLLQKLNQVESNPQLYVHEILRFKISEALRRRKRIEIPLQTEVTSEPDNSRSGFAPLVQPEDDEGFVSRLEEHDRIELVKKALKALSPFCRTFFLGILEECSVQDLWTFFRQAEPNLQRSAFDKRVFDCRKRLKLLVKDQLK